MWFYYNQFSLESWQYIYEFDFVNKFLNIVSHVVYLCLLRVLDDLVENLGTYFRNI